MLLARALLVLTLIVGAAMTGEAFAAVSTPAERLAASAVAIVDAPRQAKPAAATGGNEIGGLSFSTAVNEQARPLDPNTTFPGSTLRLWISFNYYDFKPGSRVRYSISANGDAWRSGELTCCEGANGRYAFPIENERDEPFGGAGYEVTILVGTVEASRGAFVVLGTRGFDNENCNDNSQTHRGNLSNRDGKHC